MRRIVVKAPFVLALVLGGVLALLVVAVILLLSTGAARTYLIPSRSMESTMHCARPAAGCQAATSDRIVVLTGLVSHDRGDIVTYRTPPAAEKNCRAGGGTFLHRIVGLPGERVETRLEGGAAYVYVNGERLDEPYVEEERRGSGPAESYRVPEGHYFLMGDNRSQSCDSRVFGSVPGAHVTGEVVLTYWPLDRISFR